MHHRILLSSILLLMPEKYGSGGREIRQRQAVVSYYDLDAVTSSTGSGLSVFPNEQKSKCCCSFSLLPVYQPMPQEELPLVEQVFEVQSKIIRDIASKDPV